MMMMMMIIIYDDDDNDNNNYPYDDGSLKHTFKLVDFLLI